MKQPERMNRAARTRRTAHAAMLLYATLISTSFLIGDVLAPALDPMLISAARFSIAAIVFGLVALVVDRPRLPRPRDLLRYLLLASTMVVYFVLMFEALKFTDAVTTGALFTALPLVSAFFARLLVGQRLHWRQVGLMVLGASGALVVVIDSSAQAGGGGQDQWIGVLLFLLGICSFALFSPLVRKLHRDESVLTMNFWTLTMGAVLLCVLTAPQWVRLDFHAIDAGVWWCIAWLGAINTGVTFYLLKGASTTLPSAKVMSYTYLTPALIVFMELASGEAWPAPELLLALAVTVLSTGLLQFTRDASS